MDDKPHVVRIGQNIILDGFLAGFYVWVMGASRHICTHGPHPASCSQRPLTLARRL